MKNQDLVLQPPASPCKKESLVKKCPELLLLSFFFSLIGMFGLSLKKKLFNFWFMRLKGHVFKLFFAVMRPRKKWKLRLSVNEKSPGV